MASLGASQLTASVGRLAVGLVALVAIVIGTFWLNANSQALFKDVVAARDARSAAVELRNELLAAESSAHGYLVSGNEIYLSPYERAKARARRQASVVATLFVPYAEMAEALKRLQPVVELKFTELDAAVTLKKERDDAGASARFGTNRGKALMDEASVYLNGLLRAADTRLTAAAEAQQVNAAWLRWLAIGGAIIIILFVGSAALAAGAYARGLREARDEVGALNATLEQRVADRTADLAESRDRAELLLGEVNHRVANSLALVASLVTLQSNATADAASKGLLEETRARIDAVSRIHKELYTSGDVRVVALDDYLSGLVDHLAQTLRSDSRQITVAHEIEAIMLPTDDSIGLGVIVTEWVTNAAKYAYPAGGGKIVVRLNRADDSKVILAVDDDGVGRNIADKPRGTGLGTRIVGAMAARLGARAEYLPRNPGTSARLVMQMRDAVPA
jgi:two-component sensor histidine kinase